VSAIPGSASSCCWSAWLSPSALIFITRLQVPAYCLSTVGQHFFPVAAFILCNSLPPDVQSSSSLTNFCHRLKAYLFCQSFPDILKLFICHLFSCWLCKDTCYFRLVKNSALLFLLLSIVNTTFPRFCSDRRVDCIPFSCVFCSSSFVLELHSIWRVAWVQNGKQAG